MKNLVEWKDIPLSRDSKSWFVLIPWWPFSGRFASAKKAREWGKKEGFRIVRCKLGDRP
jgi:hypothetical protein